MALTDSGLFSIVQYFLGTVEHSRMSKLSMCLVMEKVTWWKDY